MLKLRHFIKTQVSCDLRQYAQKYINKDKKEQVDSDPEIRPNPIRAKWEGMRFNEGGVGEGDTLRGAGRRLPSPWMGLACSWISH